MSDELGTGLRERSAAAARAGVSITTSRLGWLLVGFAGLVTGQQLGSEIATMIGAAVVGAAAGQLAVEPARYYMEGFVDGLNTRDAIERNAATARQRRVDRADVRGLPAGALADDGGAALGAVDDDQRPAPSTGTGRSPGISLATALGVDIEPGPPRGPLAPDGSPIAAAQGPRRSPFPDIPAAERVGQVVSIAEARPPSGGEARRRVSKVNVTK